MLAAVLAGCGGPVASATPTPTPAASHHGDPGAEPTKAALSAAFGMAFEPAGPHHELGRTAGGVELDLVGVPVEQLVLSVPIDKDGEEGRDAAADAALAFLPHLRDLLHGPDPVWDWAAAMIACRRDAERSCDEARSQGNLEVRFPDDDPGYLVLVVTRD
jgi:hypothetical protein